MLIPAKERKAVSVAVANAKEAEKNARIMEIANYAIPKARELYEFKIVEASNKGFRCCQVQLGYKEIYGTSYYGCLGKALEWKFGKNVPFPYDWETQLKIRNEKSDGWAYAYDKWVEMCETFIEDLESNGYKVQKTDSYGKPIDPKYLVSHDLKVSW